MARRVDEAAMIIEACDGHPGVGVCLDTCHLWAAGVDFATPSGLRRLRSEVRALGLDRLRLIHVNDSKDPLGSSRDRHANLGHGTIGVDAIRRVLSVPEWRGVPAIIETPAPEDLRRADLALARNPDERR
ncbi:MAG: TIM barrel protein [Acidimicrobiia bacterium]|nr:TIM barrel protein [Acidimicrobiia bacterium]